LVLAADTPKVFASRLAASTAEILRLIYNCCVLTFTLDAGAVTGF
jgi:hypothetical protein